MTAPLLFVGIILSVALQIVISDGIAQAPQMVFFPLIPVNLFIRYLFCSLSSSFSDYK